MSERRTESRRRTLLGGRLAADRLTTRDCLVRDLTVQGARLKCRTTGLGDDVTLEIPSIDGFRRDARIVWRRLEDCGVVFVRMKPPPHALPAERRVADEGC
jgi:hypothetical protein